MSDCPFCAIVGREAPARVVHETGETLAFFPDCPTARGHTLVIPKAHVPDFLHADPTVTAPVAVAAATVGSALDRLLRPDGMNTITSAREAASQSVPHLQCMSCCAGPGTAWGSSGLRIRRRHRTNSTRWLYRCGRSSARRPRTHPPTRQQRPR